MLRFIWAWLVYTWGGLHRYFGNMNSMPSEHLRAIHYFSRAYEIDPRLRQARLARAVLLWRELRRFDEALSELNTLLDADPAYGVALFNRAMVAQEIGRYSDALADLEAFLDLPAEDDFYHEQARRLVPLIRALDEED